MSYNPLNPFAEDRAESAQPISADEWTAAVLAETIKRAAALSPEAEMADLEMANALNYGRLVGIAWKNAGKRFGRRHAIPSEDHLRTPLTAEYVAMATVEQWADTCAELRVSEA